MDLNRIILEILSILFIMLCSVMCRIKIIKYRLLKFLFSICEMDKIQQPLHLITNLYASLRVSVHEIEVLISL